MSIVQQARTGALDRAQLTEDMIAQLRIVLRELKCIGSQRLLRRGVSMSNLHVLSMLERHGPMTMSGIADAVDVSLSNATGLVDRMEERGLVGRERDADDRRVVRVTLTATGRAVLADIEVFQADVLGRILGELDERELGRLTRTLDDLREAVARVAAAEPELFAHNHQFHEASAGRLPATTKSPPPS
jgi:DNA-binding MarR family transcriptional regulator